MSAGCESLYGPRPLTRCVRELEPERGMVALCQRLEHFDRSHAINAVVRYQDEVDARSIETASAMVEPGIGSLIRIVCTPHINKTFGRNACVELCAGAGVRFLGA